MFQIFLEAFLLQNSESQLRTKFQIKYKKLKPRWQTNIKHVIGKANMEFKHSPDTFFTREGWAFDNWY